MSIYEKQCKWHFAELGENSGDEGPNSAMSQSFSRFPCSALVRESIQNSLDAAKDGRSTVKVCFEFRELGKSDYPNFFQLEKHISACLKHYKGNRTAEQIYPKMINYLRSTDEVGFIRVTDYNTKGMDYVERGTDKSFYAFVRSTGVSVKQTDGSGGSFGFGKGAFFVMSPINTLMVSTRNLSGQCFFEGVTRLCSHFIDEKQRSHMGFYDNNNGEPTSDPDSIPIPFKLEDVGTRIGIMGVNRSEWNDSKGEIVKEVLRNFFVAIHHKKLVVIVDGCGKKDEKGAVTIDDEHLGNLIQRYFPDLRDIRNQVAYNPRPYYEALKEGRFFETQLQTLGHVYAYFKEVPENSTSYIVMRQLLMKVSKKSRNMGNFNGVIICDSDEGNAILGDMENSEHNEWMPENCNQTNKKTDVSTARLAEKELEAFIRECLDELLKQDSSETVQVSDLEKYLPSDIGTKAHGEKGNPFWGTPTGKYSPKEGASLTTEGEVRQIEPKKKTGKGTIKVKVPGTFTKDQSGADVGGTGGGKHAGGGSISGAGDNFGKGVVTDENGNHKILVPVEWKPIISKRKGFMDVVIFVDHNIDNAELSFEIGRESTRRSDNADDVVISESNKGQVCGLTINDVPLRGKVKNIVQISFSDQMSHSIKLGVYEIV